MQKLVRIVQLREPSEKNNKTNKTKQTKTNRPELATKDHRFDPINYLIPSTFHSKSEMSFEEVGQLTNGVQQLGFGDPNGQHQPQSAQTKKKRPARAFHNLQQQQQQQFAAELDQFPQPPGFPGFSGSNGPSPVTPFQSQFPGNVHGGSLQSAFSTPQQPFQSQFIQSFPNQAPQAQFQQQQQLHSPHAQLHQQYSYPGDRKSSTINLSNPSQSVSDDLSVPHHRQVAQEEWQFNTFKSFQNNLPPTATTKYFAYDQGCSIPKFSTLSMYQIPDSETLRNSTKLPLGLTVRPFAPVSPEEEQVPQVTMDQFDGPLRCRRCRTYINPQMQFTQDQKFICNMCKFPNAVPHEYISAIDVSGKRIDYLQRPELCKGTVDFIVPESYWFDTDTKPEVLHQIFLIDVSASNDILESTVQAIRQVVENLNNGIKIAIITYDERVHFYELDSETLHIHTVSDLEDPFIPIQQGLFVDPQENEIQINNALARITELHRNYKTPALAYGAALNTALLALEPYGGGKITATLTNIPSWSVGTLANTDDKSQGSLDFKPTSEFYSKISDDFVTKNVGLDLFVISKSSVNLINSAAPVFATAGLLKLYPNYTVEHHELQFTQEFYHSVVNTTGYQGQLKVRCSNGLQVQSYYGSILNQNAQDPKLPILSSDQEFSVLFKYDSKLKPKEDAHFQAALLYTGVDGVRRVRVINTVGAVTQDVSSVFAFADQDVVLNIIIKNCLKFISKQNPIEIKHTTTTKLTEIFTQYRALVANSNSRQAQLILPDSLTTLTAYISAFQKSKIFKTSVSNNLKIYNYYQLNSLPLDKLLLHLYPRIIALHELKESDATIDPTTGVFSIPENVRASSQFVREGGAYLIFNGESLIVWIHSRVNSLLLEDLFGVNAIENLNPDLTEFPPLSTHISQQAINIVEYYQRLLNRSLLSFRLLRQGLDAVEFQFGEYLVEDRAIDKTESYMELISLIHRKIKENVDQEKVIKNSEVTHDDSTLGQRFVHF